MDRELLKAQLLKHEGLRLKPYRDTVGKLTIGVGRNLDDKGISEGEAMRLLDGDIDETHAKLAAAFPLYADMSGPRQRALLDMAFNLGVAGLLKFKTTLGHIQAGNYAKAADAMLNSKWAAQVGQRAQTLAQMMRDG